MAAISTADPTAGYYVDPDMAPGMRFIRAESVGRLGTLASLTHLNIRRPANETPSGLSQALEVDSQFDCVSRQVRAVSIRLVSPTNEIISSIPVDGAWVSLPSPMASLFRLACDGPDGFELLAVDRAFLIAEAAGD